jgi:hypothetical protein
MANGVPTEAELTAYLTRIGKRAQRIAILNELHRVRQARIVPDEVLDAAARKVDFDIFALW